MIKIERVTTTTISVKKEASQEQARPQRQRSAPQSYVPSFQEKSYFEGLNIQTTNNNFTSIKSTYFRTVQVVFT